MSAAALRRSVALALTVACFGSAAKAAAADAQYTGPLHWSPAWPRVSAFEYGVTGVAGAAAFAIYFAVPDAEEPRWTGGIFLDDILREHLRAQTPEGRHAARTASDITALSSIAWAVGLDSIVVPIARRSSDVAGQLTSLDAEGFAVSLLISNLVFKAVARARPSYSDCQHNPLFEPLCNSSATASFPSGHTNAAFTAAGLSCANHLHVGTYGNKLGDSLACAGALTLAAATGTLRIIGDRHYATDVWVGAAIGFAVGYGLPTLLHYGRGSSDAQASQSAQPLSASFPLGPTIAGTF